MSVQIRILGRDARNIGETPAVALVNPKYPHNVGAAVRAASCFGARQVWFSGDRVTLDPLARATRLPREERMKGYRDVSVVQCDMFFDAFPKWVTPVAVEFRGEAEMLPTFEHPEHALYVFGPEDGGLMPVQLRLCHRFVMIPSTHCLNLSAAVNLVLYDRMVKRMAQGLVPLMAPADYVAQDRAMRPAAPDVDMTVWSQDGRSNQEEQR